MNPSTQPLIVLGIETSCDETAAAVAINGTVRSNVVASQAVHRAHGGVVPELASRDHDRVIVPVVKEALQLAGLQPPNLTAVAYTNGPGLLGALLVGAGFAKSMAWALNLPSIAVNHMQAHILAHFIEAPHPQFPFLCLTISGGHTQLVAVHNYLTFELLGQTHDDAVGEAFDKGAKMLGLPYPGGPEIDKLAQHGNPDAFSFPHSDMPGLNFSFSGVKTSLLYFINKHTQKNPNFITNNLPDICASYQAALVRMLNAKVKKALRQQKFKGLALAGGVAANSAVRQAMHQTATKFNTPLYLLPVQYCTDNAAMVAIAGHYMHIAGHKSPLSTAPVTRIGI